MEFSLPGDGTEEEGEGGTSDGERGEESEGESEEEDEKSHGLLPASESEYFTCLCVRIWHVILIRSPHLTNQVLHTLTHLSVSLKDVKDITDPLSKVEAGLQARGADIPLQCVHIRAQLVDLAAKVGKAIYMYM